MPKRVANALLPFLATTGMAALAAMTFLAVRSHHWPDVQLMFYFNNLVLAGYTLLPMPLVHPWNVVIFIYAVGLSFGIQRVIRGYRRKVSGEIILLSLLGFTLFVYYQGRSHDLNLLFVWWPAWMILAIFAGLLCSRIAAGWRCSRMFQSRRAGRMSVDFGATSLVIATLLIWSATAPAAIETVIKVTSSIPEGTGAISRRAEVAARVIQPKERPLVLSAHSGILLNELRRTQPIDTMGMAELIMMPEVNRIEKWLQSDPNAIVLVDSETVHDIAVRKHIMSVVNTAFQLRSLSSNCELLVFDKRSRGLASPLSVLSILGPVTPTPMLNAMPCGGQAITGRPSGGVALIEMGPVSVTVPLTIQFIVKPFSEQKPFAHILGNHPGKHAEGFVVQQNGDRVNSYLFSYGLGQTFVTPLHFELAPAMWHWVQIMLTPTEARVYVDGNLTNHSSIPPAAIANSFLPFQVGNWIEGNRPFAGRVAAVRIDNAVVAPKAFSKEAWQDISARLDAIY